MATEFYAHDGSAARKAKELWVHDGTSARKAKEVWMHDGAVSRKVFSGDPQLQLSNHSVSSTGGQTGVATYTLMPDGRVRGRTLTDGSTVDVFYDPEWAGGTFDSSVTSQYESQFTYVSGVNSNSSAPNTGSTTVSGTTYGTWTTIDNGPSRSVSRSAGAISGGTASYTFDVVIRKVGTTTPTATARITVSAQGNPP